MNHSVIWCFWFLLALEKGVSAFLVLDYENWLSLAFLTSFPNIFNYTSQLLGSSTNHIPYWLHFPLSLSLSHDSSAYLWEGLQLPPSIHPSLLTLTGQKLSGERNTIHISKPPWQQEVAKWLHLNWFQSSRMCTTSVSEFNKKYFFLRLSPTARI